MNADPRQARAMESCNECGFVYDDLDRGAIPGRLRSYPARYRQTVSGLPAAVARRRPEPMVWSALEYLCHVRDVLITQRERVILAQVEERPSLARMYRDERVELCRYGSEDTEKVLDQVDMAAQLCATVFDALDERSWSRLIVYNWPTATERDLLWLGRHTVHEADHHFLDIIGVLGRVRGSGAN